MTTTRRSHPGARDRATASKPALKDLPQRQAKMLKVKGGSTTQLMLACASGRHFK